VVLATGVTYRRLGIPSLDALIGSGVFYGATVSEAPAMKGRDICVAGGGNSAGQAAVHLAKYARAVTMLVRGAGLAETMSQYLITEIAAHPRITVRTRVEVVGGNGRGRLESLDVHDGRTGTTETLPADGLFVLIGAAPHTAWLPREIERDEWGFIVTGTDLQETRRAGPLPGDRPPTQYETSVPGIFAVGDVRHRSIKRVASAVGEGSTCISHIHDYLALT
jgi:thioredoxin reductase (NADPH)